MNISSVNLQCDPGFFRADQRLARSMPSLRKALTAFANISMSTRWLWREADQPLAACSETLSEPLEGAGFPIISNQCVVAEMWHELICLACQLGGKEEGRCNGRGWFGMVSAPKQHVTDSCQMWC